MAPRRKPRAMSRRKRAVLIGVALIGTALLIWLDRGAIAPLRSPPPTAGRRVAEVDRSRYHGRTFPVARVVDGDTLHLAVPDGAEPDTKVRLLGIDAPEMGGWGDERRYYAEEATDCAEHLAEGRPVTVYLDEQAGSRGKYGRLLAYLELPDGTILNEQLVLEGCAYADLRFRHSHFHKYKQLEASARALGKGLWPNVTPERTPHWRQEMLAE